MGPILRRRAEFVWVQVGNPEPTKAEVPLAEAFRSNTGLRMRPEVVGTVKKLGGSVGAATEGQQHIRPKGAIACLDGQHMIGGFDRAVEIPFEDRLQFESGS